MSKPLRSLRVRDERSGVWYTCAPMRARASMNSCVVTGCMTNLQALQNPSGPLRTLPDPRTLGPWDPLATAGLPGSADLLARALRVDFALAAVVLLPAATERAAQAVAYGLLLGLVGGRCGLLRLGVRVVLAAHELDGRQVRRVAAAVAEPQQSRVAAVTLGVARRDGVE